MTIRLAIVGLGKIARDQHLGAIAATAAAVNASISTPVCPVVSAVAVI